MKSLQLNLFGGSSATIPTNSPELKLIFLEGGIAASNCFEWLMEVSELINGQAFPILHNLSKPF
jgi:hypothetical protein